MQVLYDTTTVRPLDRYDYYRERAGTELAPVAIHGRQPGKFLATMSFAQIDDFTIEVVTQNSDVEIMAQRTRRLIRSGDPDCFRICLSVAGAVRMEQAGNQTLLHARNLGFYDLSQPSQTTLVSGPMRLIVLTFPRALMPFPRDLVRPLLGTVMRRDLSGRSLIAQLLIALTDVTAEQSGDPYLIDALREGTLGLIREALDRSAGITPRTRRLVLLAGIRIIIHRALNDPELDPGRIATAANISSRYLHKICQDAGFKPMELVKRMRAEACHQSLRDPNRATAPIKEIMAEHGYRRPDQFARDFKQLVGLSPTQARAQATGSSR